MHADIAGQLAAAGPVFTSNRGLLLLFVAMVLAAIVVMAITIKIYESRHDR